MPIVIGIINGMRKWHYIRSLFRISNYNKTKEEETETKYEVEDASQKLYKLKKSSNMLTQTLAPNQALKYVCSIESTILLNSNDYKLGSRNRNPS